MEIKTSQYYHPEQTSGQHTNGPAYVFVRENDSSPWYRVERGMYQHKIRKLVAELGWLKFVERHCAKVCD